MEVSQLHMGLMVHLRVWSADPEAARAACAAAFERIAELNDILSDYEPESELSRLVRAAGAGAIPVSEELFEVLDASLRLARQSDGRLDPTARPAIRLWRQARRDGRLPDPAAMQKALANVGYARVRLDAQARTVELEAGTELDFGAIAKGYVGDEALRVLRGLGFPSACFDAGGDVVAGDPPPDEAGWLVLPEGVGLPELTLARQAAAISGDASQFVVIDGVKYGHVIDVRTGTPVPHRPTCLVTAPTGFLADPLATLSTLMPQEEFEAFLREHAPEARVWRAGDSAPRGQAAPEAETQIGYARNVRIERTNL